MDFTVDGDFDGRKLLHFLRGRLDLSHNLLCDLKACGGIAVNGENVTVRKIVYAGDRVTLTFPPEIDTDIAENLTDIRILWEDEFAFAADKPPYMPTHESHDHRGDTLENCIKAIYNRRGLPFVFRAVNRLDGDTSGIVLMAKSRYAADRFSKAHIAAAKAVQNGGESGFAYKKIYTAFVNGIMPLGYGEISGYIRRADDSIILRQTAESGRDSEFAITKYEVSENVGNISVVRCMPITGRTHQLRVHLASIGHPIVGDDMYGGGFEMKRQALHAGELCFTHPISGENIRIASPLPEDMTEFINSKRKTDFE